MLLAEIHKHYGTWADLTRALKLGHNTYQVWRKQGFIPWEAQLLIQWRTDGLFKACEEHAEPHLIK